MNFAAEIQNRMRPKFHVAVIKPYYRPRNLVMTEPLFWLTLGFIVLTALFGSAVAVKIVKWAITAALAGLSLAALSQHNKGR